MRVLAYIFLLLCLGQSCDEKKPQATTTNRDAISELVETDRSFSRLSEQEGMKSAYIEYIDSNGVLLRPGMVPAAGANAIDYLIQQNDTAFNITRQPQKAVVAASGDLGYTYGIFSYRIKTTDSTTYGTYITVWKKQKDGNWKFVLDSGNDGIGEQYVSP